MSRRRHRTSPFEDIVEIISRLPWWVGCLLAVVSFIILHNIAGAEIAKPNGPGELGSFANKKMLATFAFFGQIVVPVALGLGSFISFINELNKKKQCRDYDAQLRATPVTIKNRTPGHSPKPPNPSRTDTINNLIKEGIPNPPQPEKPQDWTAQVLSSLEWKRFETVCTEYLRMIGYDARETRIGADGGVDIWVYKDGTEKPVGIVQCKAWTTYKVGIKPVRELLGVMAHEGIANGKFITSGEFTSEALGFADGKRLQLISGEAFVAAIRKLPVEKQQKLLEIALAGDYRTPTCPQCGVKMQVRQGGDSDRKFWGCPAFPRCRATLVYKEG